MAAALGLAVVVVANVATGDDRRCRFLSPPSCSAPCTVPCFSSARDAFSPLRFDQLNQPSAFCFGSFSHGLDRHTAVRGRKRRSNHQRIEVRLLMRSKRECGLGDDYVRALRRGMRVACLWSAVAWVQDARTSLLLRRLSINPGAPGFVYPFHPHVKMKEQGAPPHILLAGDCSDAAYVYRPTFSDEVCPFYRLGFCLRSCRCGLPAVGARGLVPACAQGPPPPPAITGTSKESHRHDSPAPG